MLPDDSIDLDCNGFDTITCIVDFDEDGYGTDAGTTVLADDGSCDTAQGESTTSDDCNDGDSGINPGATDTPGDGIDQDCSGTDTITCYRDFDRDGFGDDAYLRTGALGPGTYFVFVDGYGTSQQGSYVGTIQVVEGRSDSGPLYRVRVGPLASVNEADRIANTLVSQGISDTRVIID